MNKISLVFLQRIKAILTLFFMPTILFTNLILMQIYAIQAISRSCTCVSRLTLTNLRKPRREHFAFVHNDYLYTLSSRANFLKTTDADEVCKSVNKIEVLRRNLHRH